MVLLVLTETWVVKSAAKQSFWKRSCTRSLLQFTIQDLFFAEKLGDKWFVCLHSELTMGYSFCKCVSTNVWSNLQVKRCKGNMLNSKNIDVLNTVYSYTIPLCVISHTLWQIWKKNLQLIHIYIFFPCQPNTFLTLVYIQYHTSYIMLMEWNEKIQYFLLLVVKAQWTSVFLSLSDEHAVWIKQYSVLHSYNIIGLSMDSKRKSIKIDAAQMFYPTHSAFFSKPGANINPQCNSTANGFIRRFHCVMLIANAALILELQACMTSGLQRFGKLPAFQLHNTWYFFPTFRHVVFKLNLRFKWHHFSQFIRFTAAPSGTTSYIFFHMCSGTAQEL